MSNLGGIIVFKCLWVFVEVGCSYKWLVHYEPFCEKNSFLHMRKKDADQLCGNRKADQRLCFRYIDSTIPIFPKSEFSSL